MEIDMKMEVIIGFLFTPVKAFSALAILKQEKKSIFYVTVWDHE